MISHQTIPLLFPNMGRPDPAAEEHQRNYLDKSTVWSNLFHKRQGTTLSFSLKYTQKIIFFSFFKGGFKCTTCTPSGSATGQSYQLDIIHRWNLGIHSENENGVRTHLPQLFDPWKWCPDTFIIVFRPVHIASGGMLVLIETGPVRMVSAPESVYTSIKCVQTSLSWPDAIIATTGLMTGGFECYNR